MEKLFNDSELMVKDRPKAITSEQSKQFYKAQAKEILKNGWSTCDSQTIVSDLETVSLNDSGFEIAKELESGWDSQGEYNFTTDFIEFLESLSFAKSRLLEENVKAWVKAHSIKPLLEVGQKLQVDRTLSFSIASGKIVYVNRVLDERGCYLIDEDKNRNGGVVIAFEVVESKTSKQ